jgi:hypothetical protein
MHDYLTAQHIAHRQATRAADARRRSQVRLALAARSSQPGPWRIGRTRALRVLAQPTVSATA